MEKRHKEAIHIRNNSAKVICIKEYLTTLGITALEIFKITVLKNEL